MKTIGWFGTILLVLFVLGMTSAALGGNLLSYEQNLELAGILVRLGLITSISTAILSIGALVAERKGIIG